VGSFAVALKKTVKSYNETAHSSTGFIPALLNKADLPPAVIAELLKRLNSKAEGTQLNARYQPPLFPGDKVRIEVGELLSAIKLQQKAGSYKSSHESTYSREVFTVLRQDKNNFVIVVEKPDLKFSRGGCLKVSQDAKDLSVAKEPAPKRVKGASQTDGLPVTRTLRSAKEV
jgi:hypothetical protein